MARLFFSFCFWASLYSLWAQEQTLDYMNNGVVHVNPFGSGYIAGTNGYGDEGKYQRFDLTKGLLLTAVGIVIGEKEIKGTPDSVAIVVRDKQDTIPSAYRSQMKRALSDFEINEQITKVFLSPPVLYAALDSFFVGVEWDNNIDDEFAILADLDTEGDLADRAWEQYEDGTFHSLNENSSFSWHLDTDLHIRLYFLPSSGTYSPDNEYFNLIHCAPNPALDQTVVSLKMKKTGSVKCSLYDLYGRLCTELPSRELTAGEHALPVELAGLPSGAYLLCVQTAEAFSTIKIEKGTRD